MCARVIIEGKHSLTWAFYDSTCVRAGAGLKRTPGQMDQADSSKVSQRMKFIILLAAVAVRNSNLNFNKCHKFVLGRKCMGRKEDLPRKE